jgi:hypothetical protein
LVLGRSDRALRGHRPRSAVIGSSPLRSSALGPSGRFLLGNAIAPPPALLLGPGEQRSRLTPGLREVCARLASTAALPDGFSSLLRVTRPLLVAQTRSRSELQRGLSAALCQPSPARGGWRWRRCRMTTSQRRVTSIRSTMDQTGRGQLPCAVRRRLLTSWELYQLLLTQPPVASSKFPADDAGRSCARLPVLPR